MNILVTGGAGYIGSHAVRRLLDLKYNVAVLDNLSHGHEAAVDRRAELIRADLGDEEIVTTLLRAYDIRAILHFAGSTDVITSAERPLKHYSNNFSTPLLLIAAARRQGVEKFVFSSSAAVYGVPERLPLTEMATLNPVTPYGRSKLMLEWALADCSQAYGIGFTALRYFNVAGAHPSGEIGEDHRPETHLIPKILRAALDKSPRVTVYGTDYPTPDGTCVRDYLHVEDLIDAHVLAVEALKPRESHIYNVGTEAGFSVLEVIRACERVTGRSISVEPGERRPGDAPILITSNRKITEELNWRRRYPDLDTMIAHAYNWHKLHPRGYERAPGPLPKERRRGLQPLFG